MAWFYVIPFTLLLAILSVDSLILDDKLKDSISLNGFEEKDVLQVFCNIYDNRNKPTGVERVLYPVNYLFNEIPYSAKPPKPIDIPIFGRVLVKFSKNPQVVQESEKSMENIRFHVWAANRTNMEVTELYNYIQDAVELPTDEEKDDLKRTIALMINESPEFEMKFQQSGNVVMSLAEMQDTNL